MFKTDLDLIIVLLGYVKLAKLVTETMRVAKVAKIAGDKIRFCRTKLISYLTYFGEKNVIFSILKIKT